MICLVGLCFGKLDEHDTICMYGFLENSGFPRSSRLKGVCKIRRALPTLMDIELKSQDAIIW